MPNYCSEIMAPKRPHDDSKENGVQMARTADVSSHTYDLDKKLLELSWQTKMRIIKNFDELSWCLTVKRVPESKKNALIQENFDLIKVLLSLPQQSEGIKRDAKSIYKRIKKEGESPVEEEIKDVPILLPWSVRAIIIEYLSKNHFILTQKHMSIDDRIKLRKENFDLSHSLNDLKVSPIAEINLDSEDSDIEEEPPVNSTAMLNNISAPNIQDIMHALQNYPELLSGASNEPVETTIEFKFKLSQLKESKVLHSAPTQFKGMSWRVRTTIKEINNQEVFAIQLQLNSPDYNCQACMDFKIYNNKTNSFNVKQADHHFDKIVAKGCPNYLPLDQLNEENGFVKDDEVFVIVLLKVVSSSKKTN